MNQPSRSATVTYDSKTKLISIALPPIDSPSKAAGNIQLYRPSATNLDRKIKFAPDKHGIQTIDASSLLPGLWKVRISWTEDQKDYYLDQKIVIGTKNS